MDDNGSTASPYAVEVGNRLRAVRKQKGLSLQAVEELSNQEFRASILGAYERGQRRISVPRLQRLAQLYGTPVDHFLPPGSEEFEMAGAESGTQPVQRPRVVIDLTKLNNATGEERDVLQRYLTMVQLERQDFNGRMLTIRWDDLRVIGALFRRTAADMHRRLAELGILYTD
jgi:transcriptional regulator with XRE-family HTH domain